MAHVIEGTWEEIKAHEAEFAGHRLRLIVDPDEFRFEGDVAPPIVIRDRVHLIQVLTEAAGSPSHEVSQATWDERHKELDAHFQNAQ